MLDSTLKAQLKTYLEKVTQPFEIVASLDDREKSQEMLSLLEDITSLSDKITLRTDGKDVRRPSFALNRIGGNI
ncbi:alkyl hydroperoxide reductase subunit F, partial [Pseudomonas xanthomarina]|nr:alkyl hydroperoxide reductase subunit F [Stutzerimonas xanthomarina]